MIPMARRVLSVSKKDVEALGVTARLRLQSKLLFEANEELKKATKAKSELLSRLSHEFRKTLNVVIGFTELLLEEKPGKINEEQKASLNDIHSGSKRLLYLINHYLE